MLERRLWVEALGSSLLVSGNNKAKNAKGLVLQVLSKDWPLSAKQVFGKITKTSSGTLTYQGVHKALGSLLADGVILKNGGGYALSKMWLEKQGRWLNDTKKQYSGGAPPDLSRLSPNSSVSYTFTGVISVPYWLIDNEAERIPPDGMLIKHIFFGWPAQMVSEEQHKTVKKLAEYTGKFVLCRGNAPADIYCLKYLEKTIGVKFIAGAPVADDSDIVVFRDFVINVYWPAPFKQLIRKAFSEEEITATMQQVYDYVFLGEGAKLQIPVVITRNAEMAKQIINETKALFEKKK